MLPDRVSNPSLFGNPGPICPTCPCKTFHCTCLGTTMKKYECFFCDFLRQTVWVQAPEVIKKFMLNSAEHEICPAHKYSNANNIY